MAKIRYRFVDHDGDVIHPTLVHYETSYPVKLREVTILQGDDDEEVLELTLEYLHGPGQPRLGQPAHKQTYCTNCGHKLPE